MEQQFDKIKQEIIEKEKEKLNITIKDLTNKLTSAALNPDYEFRKEQEINELKAQIEARKDENYLQKKEINTLKKRIQELDVRHDMQMREKEKEIQEVKSDLKASQDFTQVQIREVKQRQNKIENLEEKLKESDLKLKEK